MVFPKTFIAFVTVGILVAFGTATRAELVGYWAFDTLDADGTVTPNLASGDNRSAGRLAGDAHLETDVGDGVVSRASVLALDGDGDWVRIDHGVARLGGGHSFTIAAWLKTDAKSLAWLSKGKADGAFQRNELVLFVAEGHGGRDTGLTAHSQGWLSSRAVKINDGRWHHVAVACDAAAGTKRVFVDGVDVTTEASYKAGADTGAVIRIGTSEWRDAGDFRGHIDDVAMFDEALSPYQIRNVMRKGPTRFNVLPAGLEAKDLAGLPPWDRLIKVSQAVRIEDEDESRRIVDAAGIQLGTWHCAGPFKDAAEGLHFRSFATVFPPEAQVLAAGGKAIDLSETWRIEIYSGIKPATRRWVPHPEWVDGYVNQLPVGPPPMKNETCYLYRTIEAKKAATVRMHVLALDDVQAWLDGESVGVAHNPSRGDSSRFPASLMATLRLKPGENRLLIKITSMHGAHGFAFALPPLTPSNSALPGKARWRPHRFYPGNEPFVGNTAKNGELLDQYEQYNLREDRIDTKAASSVRAKDFAEAVLRRLALPRNAPALLPKAKDAAGAAALRDLYLRTCRFMDALEKVRDFHLKIAPTPMYDPARLTMAEALEATAHTTEPGDAYLAALDALRTAVERALALWRDGSPECERAALEAAGAIDRMWSEQMQTLPPIAFIRCPPFAINAITPYIARGASPAAICILDPKHPNRPPRAIYEDPAGAIFDMNASYDGKTVFFSARRKNVEGGWHIYEIGTDGRGLKQITRGPSDNISPLPLPGGEIMFVSTRSGNTVICQQGASGVLYVCNRDGTNVRRVSGNTLSDHSPQIMNDGRVLFTRWDYGIDKNVFARQSLWTVNPDGTHFQLFSANTIEDPNGFWEARAVPQRNELVCVFGPHHNYHAGMIGLIWNRLGYEAPRGEGFRWITTEMPSVGDITLPWGYQDPYPLHERLFLVSFGGDGGRKNRLYLLDDRGNRKCLYEAPGNLGCWNPLPLNPRPRPPVIAIASDNPTFAYRDPAEANRNPDDSRTGTFVLQNVYEGLLSQGVRQGEIRALRIIEQVPRVGTMNGMALYGHWSVIGRGTMYVRRIIGTVPVEEDGSAYFVAPASRDISFDALDAEGRAIRWMGSTTQIMPGETNGCIGCHESRYSAPDHSARSTPLAFRRKRSVPEYPEWTDKGIVDFNRVVQPVLNKYCVECHGGPTPDGLLDLSGDKTHYFSMAYDQLLDSGVVHYIPVSGIDHSESVAKTRGALISRIREYIEKEHGGRVLPAEARRRIYAWIDANVPYYGTYEVTDRRVVGGRDRWYVQDPEGWFQKEFLPVFNRRCMPCHERYVSPQTYNYNPRGDGKIRVSSKLWNDTALTQFQLGHGRISWTGQIGPDHRINLTHPEWSRMLAAPLPKRAGGLGLCPPGENMPRPFADRNDPDYQAMLRALRRGQKRLLANPRVDTRKIAVHTNQTGR